ncbi:MAG: DUF1963 domain-containing protein [Planctomycetota bacterium]
MDPIAEFRRLFAEQGRSDLAERMLAVARPALHIRKRFTETIVPRKPWLGLVARRPRVHREPLSSRPGDSRLGGAPDLPADFAWPHADGRPMGFLLQLRCEDLTAHDIDLPLPAAGTLHVFAGLHIVTWAAAVRSTPPGTTLRETPPPPGLDIQRGFPVEFVPIPSFPDPSSPEFDALALEESEEEQVVSNRIHWERRHLGLSPGPEQGEWGSAHQLGGTPNSVQGDVRIEFELSHRGLGVPWRKQPWLDAEPHAGRWRLLLELDADDDVGWSWGDAGRLYFGILEDDLRAGRLDRVVATMQCS